MSSLDEEEALSQEDRELLKEIRKQREALG
jgi:hypothetical protein